MGDWIPSSPTVRGTEWLPTTAARRRLSSPLQALAMRIRPGAVTPTNLHVHVEPDGDPGIAVEIVSSLAPTVTREAHLPGTDTGATTTSWVDAAAAAANYSDVDDPANVAEYVMNNTSVGRSGQLALLFRGNSTALAAKRINAVTLEATVIVRKVDGNDTTIRIDGGFDIAGTRYWTGGQSARRSGKPVKLTWTHTTNPATGVPWTLANVNALVATTATDEWGIRLRGRAASGGVRVVGLRLLVDAAPENRFGYYYSTTAPANGWNELALTAPAALSANTWYYAVVAPLRDTGGLTVPTVAAPGVVAAASASASTGEHRRGYAVTLAAPGGTGTTTTARPGELLPALLDTGAINSQSASWVDLTWVPINAAAAIGAGFGTEITTAASTTYGGIAVPVAWEDPARRPRQPLTINVRTGTLTDSGGVLVGTATLYPDDVDDGLPRVALARFPAGVSFASTSSHRLFFSCAATKGWKVPSLDSRSDLVTGTTAAEVQGATFGGTTDSRILAGAEDDRYDIPAALIATPAALTATVTADDPRVKVAWTASALTTTWGGYRVWRRPVAVPAGRWTLIGQIDPPSGTPATDAEAAMIEFSDFEAVGANQYAVTVVDAVTGFESARQTTLTVTAPSSTRVTRLVSNAAPWVLAETDRLETPSLDTADRTVVRELAGRDHAVTRTPLELPTRTFSGRWHTFGRIGDSDFAALRAAASAGETVAVVEPLGRRTIGSLIVKQAAEREGGQGWGVDIEVTETTRHGEPAGWNLPARLGFDGTGDYVTVPDAPELDPTGAGFTIVWVGIAPTAATKALIAKGNPGISDGWVIGTDGSGKLLAIFDGVTAAATALGTAASSGVHVYAATTSGSTSHKLWVDGAVTATSTTATGSVASAAALTVAASNAGASAVAVCQARAWGIWNTELAADAMADVVAYFTDHSAALPAGCVLLHDVADDRCWPGVGTTLANLAGTQISTGGTALAGTLAGDPYPVGDPWPLRLLDGEA